MRTSPPAYVLRLGPTGLTVVRALGRAGVPVVSLHSDARDPAARSRYARARLLPPMGEQDQAWLDALREEGGSSSAPRGVIFPIGDEGWLFLARHRHALAEHFSFALPAADNLAEWPGKAFQYQAAMAAGVPVPRTLFPRTTEEAVAAATELGFPCVIKPSYSQQWRAAYHWQKAVLATSPEALLAFWREGERPEVPLLVQEYVPGGDDHCYNFHSYLDRRSHPLAVNVIRKVRQYPPHIGTSSFSVSVMDPGEFEPIRDQGLALLQSLEFRGISSVEFKRDARTGEFKLLEVNLRPGMMTAVTVDSGLNLPYVAYLDLLGRPVPPPRPLKKRQVVLISFDIQSFRRYRARGELTTWQWLRSLRGRTREYYFAWDDFRPFLGHVHRLIRGALR